MRWAGAYLQERDLLLQPPQLLDLGGLQLAVALAPDVQRLHTDSVLLGNLRNRRLVNLIEDPDYLLVGESGLAHALLADLRSHPLNVQRVRQSPRRSRYLPLRNRQLGGDHYEICCVRSANN